MVITMKKFLALLLAALLLTALLGGCGKQKADRILYQSDLKKYVTLGEYKGLTVDTKSDEFQSVYEEILSSDVSAHNLYVKKTEGTVQEGDTANIDYEGKKDGVAFAGGTAQGYDLTIGSNQFIPGFESGLIGKEIGSTVDLNLTFPESYSSAELAGQAVVFTVKINYVTTTEARKPEEYYSELDFSTAEDYQKDVRERAVKQFLSDAVIKNAKVKEYPEKDLDILYTAYKNRVEQNIKQNTGSDLAAYLQYAGQTEESFKNDLVTNQIKPEMDEQMVQYAILDRENLPLTADEIDAAAQKLVESYGSGVTKEMLTEFYGEYYFEALAVGDAVTDYLYQNAKIR